MTNQPTEIAIVGGGMNMARWRWVWRSKACRDGNRTCRACAAVADSQPDVRISAISAASVALLADWAFGRRCRGCVAIPYRRLETREWETPGVVLDAAELVAAVSYMVENNVLQQALWHAGSAPRRDAARSGFTGGIATPPRWLCAGIR